MKPNDTRAIPGYPSSLHESRVPNLVARTRRQVSRYVHLPLGPLATTGLDRTRETGRLRQVESGERWIRPGGLPGLGLEAFEGCGSRVSHRSRSAWGRTELLRAADIRDVDEDETGEVRRPPVHTRPSPIGFGAIWPSGRLDRDDGAI